MVQGIGEQLGAGVFAELEARLGTGLVREQAVYGNHGDTAGVPTERGTWLRVQRRTTAQINAQSWAGFEMAVSLEGVARPELYRSLRWFAEGGRTVWRADEMTLVRAQALSASGSLTAAPELDSAWWAALARSLAALAAHETCRVGMAQEHLTRRITEVYGPRVDTTVPEWRTAHADLHWGNLTAPQCWILDWEDWGRGPRGLDAATLWGFSLGVPELAARVRQEFAAGLETRSGMLARLLFCANAARAAARGATPMPFTAPARRAATELLADLGG